MILSSKLLRSGCLVLAGAVGLTLMALSALFTRDVLTKRPIVIGVAEIDRRDKLIVWQQFDDFYTTYLSHYDPESQVRTYVINPDAWRWRSCEFRLRGLVVDIVKSSDIEASIELKAMTVHQNSFYRGTLTLKPIDVDPFVLSTIFDEVDATTKVVRLDTKTRK